MNEVEAAAVAPKRDLAKDAWVVVGWSVAIPFIVAWPFISAMPFFAMARASVAEPWFWIMAAFAATGFWGSGSLWLAARGLASHSGAYMLRDWLRERRVTVINLIVVWTILYGLVAYAGR